MRTFRVFVSSTFADLVEERNALQRRVWPELARLCEKEGFRFQAIDLRWGVPSEAALDQRTSRICLDELRRCQTTSPRPNFIILLGNRYGWRPLPDEIEQQEFEAIEVKATQLNLSTAPLLREWYLQDLNAVPAVYYLRSRRAGTQEADDKWWPTQVEQPLRSLFLRCVDALWAKDDPRRIHYERSLTEREILAGALNPAAKDALDHVFAYFRDVEYLDTVTRVDQAEANLLRPFVDFVSATDCDTTARDQHRDLKKRLEATLGERHIRKFQATWTGKSVSQDHLDRLCDAVLVDLRGVIESEIAKFTEIKPLDAEIAAHEQFGEVRGGKDRFKGREILLSRIADYQTAAEQNRPLVIFGPAGTGKSAIIARAAEEARERHPQAVILERFIGATPPSVDARSLLQSLCEELGREFQNNAEVSLEYRELVSAFRERLAWATAERPVILFLDAVDQLAETDNARSLVWLPRQLPPHVRVVVSVLENLLAAATDAGNKSPTNADPHTVLKRRAKEGDLLPIEDYPREDAKALLDYWLRADKRTVTADQEKLVLEAFAKCPRPLFLKLASEEAKQWRSDSRAWKMPTVAPQEAKLLADEMLSAIINQLFDRLSEKSNHGEQLVERAIGYLVASKNGLTEDELLGLLSADKEFFEEFVNRAKKVNQPLPPGIDSLPVAVWVRLYSDLQPYLTTRRADGTTLLAFYHRSLEQVARQRFLSTPEIAGQRHKHIAIYFSMGYTLYHDSEPTSINHPLPRYLVALGNHSRLIRSLSELPYHLFQHNQFDTLLRLLTDYDFLTAKCATNAIDSLLADLRLLKMKQPEISSWLRFFETRAHLLRRGDNHWKAHRIFWQLSLEAPDSSQVNAFAKDWFRVFPPTESIYYRIIPSATDATNCILTIELNRQLKDAKEAKRRQNHDRLFKKESGCVEPSGDSIPTPATILNSPTSEIWAFHDEVVITRYHDSCIDIVSQRNGGLLARYSFSNGETIREVHLSGGVLCIVTSANRLTLIDAASGEQLPCDSEVTFNVGGILSLNDAFLIWTFGGTLSLRSAFDGAELIKNSVDGDIQSVHVFDRTHILISQGTGTVYFQDQRLQTLLSQRLLNSPVVGFGTLGPRQYAIWDSQGSLAVIDIKNVALSRSFNGNTEQVQGCLGVSEQTFLTWDANGLRLWHLSDHSKPLATFKCEGVVGSVKRGDRSLVLFYLSEVMRTHYHKEHYLKWSGLSQVASRHRERVYYFSDFVGAVSLSEATLHVRDQLLPNSRGGILGVVHMDQERLLTWSLTAPVAVWSMEGAKIKELTQLDIRTLVKIVRLSNNRFLSIHTSGQLELWNSETGESVKLLSEKQGPVSQVLSLSLERFAVISEDLSVTIWEWSRGNLIAVLQGHGAPICGLLEVSTNRLVSWTRDCEIKFWDISKAASTFINSVRGGGLPCIVKQLSDEFAVSCHWGVIKSWNTRTGKMVARLDLIPDNVNCLEIVKEDVVLFWCRGFTIWHDVFLWRVSDAKPNARFDLYDGVTNVDDVWVTYMAKKDVYEIVIQGANDTEFVFHFDSLMRPISRPSGVENGLFVFKGRDNKSQPRQDRRSPMLEEEAGYAYSYSREQSRYNVNSQVREPWIIIKDDNGTLWHSSSPTVLVEPCGDGRRWLAASEDGELAVLTVW